jgi:hypothetical protein
MNIDGKQFFVSARSVKNRFLPARRHGAAAARRVPDDSFLLAGVTAQAQVNSGSNGSDGAFILNANNPPAIPLV